MTIHFLMFAGGAWERRAGMTRGTAADLYQTAYEQFHLNIKGQIFFHEIKKIRYYSQFQTSFPPFPND